MPKGKYIRINPRSKEVREKIRKSLTGRKRPPRSEEWSRKIKEANIGKRASLETRLKMGRAHKGEKHWNWQGGITLLYFQVRNSLKYRQWRSDVFTRDNFGCVLCGDNRGRNLEADHYPEGFADIFYGNKIKNIQEAIDCEKLWNINNGRTLCHNCHRKTPNYGRKIIMDKRGNSTTMGQMMLPQYKNALESGKQEEFKLLGV